MALSHLLLLAGRETLQPASKSCGFLTIPRVQRQKSFLAPTMVGAWLDTEHSPLAAAAEHTFQATEI